MMNLNFTQKLILIVLCVSLISMIAIFSFSYYELFKMSKHSQEVSENLGNHIADMTEQEMIKWAEEYLSQISKSQVKLYNTKLERMQDNVVKMAGYMEDLYRNQSNFVGRKLPTPNQAMANKPSAQMILTGGVLLSQSVESEMRLISNAEYLFGNIFKVNHYLSSLYLASETGIFFRYMLGGQYTADFDPRNRPWYINAKKSTKPVWVEPYMDAFTNELCSTCAVSYKDRQGKIAGVVAMDILLTTILSDIYSLRLGNSGYSFILDSRGYYLAHPEEAPNTDGFSKAEGDFKELLKDMMSLETGIKRVTVDGNDYYISFAPLVMTGWSLGIAVEYEEVISIALKMKAYIDSQANVATEQINDMLYQVTTKAFILVCIMIISVIIISIWVSKSITTPILKLTNGVKELATGNFNSKIDISSNDEIGILAECYNKMTDDLKKYIENLTEITAEKERIGAELSVATEIQADMLPKIFPPFSGRDDIHIAPMIQPAKEVGGDFYDFFFIDKEQTKLALVIADVSGKGVPAALFMVIAKVLIKNNNDLPPDQVLYTVNNLLCHDNNSNMFVTTFYSVIDLNTGEFTYANAGHNPPLLYTEKDKKAEYLILPKSPPLAVFPNKKYTSQSLTLSKGDTLLLFTDGVTEAFNPSSEMYGIDRLLHNTSHLWNLPVNDIVVEIYNSIKEFADIEPQSDDITILCCKFLR